jgi:hypothetical protein
MAFDSNDGVSRLAAALDSRMKQHADKPLCLDFAEIQADGSLLSNTFPIAIPKEDYRVCRQLTLERREMHSAMCRLSILGKHIFRNQCGSYRQEIEC